MSEEALAENEVQCRHCHARYVPDVVRDYYSDDDSRTNGLCEQCFMTQAMTGSLPGATPDPTPLSDMTEHIEGVCKGEGGSSACRYLCMGDGGIACAKGSVIQSVIDGRAESMGAKGDNCSGPPDFKPSEQK